RQVQPRADPDFKDKATGGYNRPLPIACEPRVPHRQIEKTGQDQALVNAHAGGCSFELTIRQYALRYDRTDSERSQRCSDCSEAQDDARRTCAHLRRTALGRWERPSREALAKREQSTSWHQSQPRLLRGARTGWRYALPLDTALMRS